MALYHSIVLPAVAKYNIYLSRAIQTIALFRISIIPITETNRPLRNRAFIAVMNSDCNLLAVANSAYLV